MKYLAPQVQRLFERLFDNWKQLQDFSTFSICFQTTVHGEGKLRG